MNCCTIQYTEIVKFETTVQYSIPQIYENVVCNRLVCPAFLVKKETFSFLIAFPNCDVPQSVAAALIKVNPEPAIFSFIYSACPGWRLHPWDQDEMQMSKLQKQTKHPTSNIMLCQMH